MRMYGTRLVVIAMVLVLGHAAGAEDETAKTLFYESGDGSKALFGSAGGAVQNAETGAGQDYTTENIGGLGGITNYYEKLNNPGVMHYVELVQAGSNTVKRASSRHIFRTGDRIRIHITSNGDGYLHAVHRGSTGSTKMLPVSAGGRVSTSTEVVIPSDGGWLRFDDRKGIEEIDLLFTSHPTAAREELVPTGDPKLFARVQHSIEVYGASKDLILYDQEGEEDVGVYDEQTEKDLVIEGSRPASSSAAAGGAQRAGYAADSEALAAPGSYAVNTAGEPVVVKIRLRHQ